MTIAKSLTFNPSRDDSPPLPPKKLKMTDYRRPGDLSKAQLRDILREHGLTVHK